MTVKQLRVKLRSLGLPTTSLCGVRLVKADMVKLIDRYEPEAKPQLRVDTLGRRYVRFVGYTQKSMSVTKTVPMTDHVVDNNKMVGPQLSSNPLQLKQPSYAFKQAYKPRIDRSLQGMIVSSPKALAKPDDQVILDELRAMTASIDEAKLMHRILSSRKPRQYDLDRENERRVRAIVNIRDKHMLDSCEWKHWNNVFQASI